jgi:hypothetical protein
MPGWDTKCFYFHDAAVTNGVDDRRSSAPTRASTEQQRALLPSTLPDVRSDNLHFDGHWAYKNFRRRDS